jgi:cell division protein FtsL
MKAHAMTQTAEHYGRLRLRTLVFAAMTLVLLFSIVYVRHLCIKTGYEISNLSQKLENTEIEYVSLLDKRSKEYDTENLYKKAKSVGLLIPEPKRTFYVK